MLAPLKGQALLLALLAAACDHGAPVDPRQETRPFGRLHPEFSKRSHADYWRLTRDCTVVVGSVVTVAARVTMEVEQVLKGEGVPGIVSFPAPPRLPDHPVELAHADPSAVRFKPGERWIFFLDAPSLGVYTFRAGASGTEVPHVEDSVKESLAFDALLDNRSRCAFLVQVAVDRGRSWRPALQLLGQCNEAEFLHLLAPLATDDLGKRIYWDLLARNPGPGATTVLRRFLQSESPPLLSQVIDALGRREPENEELSRELMSYLTHSDPLVRRSAVFVLGLRDYRAAFPAIVVRLDDTSPDVRAFALSWPWYAYVKDHPEVLKQIKRMRGDPDPRIRTSARRALAGVSIWVRLWYFGR